MAEFTPIVKVEYVGQNNSTEKVVHTYRYDDELSEDVNEYVRTLVAKWAVRPEQCQIDWLRYYYAEPMTFAQVLNCVRIKFVILTKHCQTIKQRLREDVDAIRNVLMEITKFPLGALDESIPSHIPWNQRAGFIPCLKDLREALDRAIEQSVYAESQILLVTTEAEKEHRKFIFEGLWTSSNEGQRPKSAAIQKALNIAAKYQQEIIVWQDFFHYELEKLQSEIRRAEIRTQRNLNFQCWEYLKRRLDLLDFYKNERHFMR